MVNKLKQQTACFTGHREIPPEQIPIIKAKLRGEIIRLIEQGIIYYGCGGARGFDLFAAQIVLELKTDYPQIKLIMILPCKNQTKGWNGADKAQYDKALAAADKIVYTSDSYFSGCMQKRNRHMLDCSSYCICYLTKATGGTAYTVNYAKSKGLRIFNIY